MLSRRRLVRRALAGGTAVLTLGALALGGMPAAGAASSASNTTSAKAVAWLDTQQQPNGGFEVAGFPGFETRDAALAIAETAQTGSQWNPVEARDAVTATVKNGKNPLDSIEAFVAEPSLGAGNAAKTIVLTTAPFGLDPTNFAGVNLVAKVAAGAHPDGSYGTQGAFSDTLYAALADRLVTGSVPAATVAYIRGAQQANGGWNFAGDSTGTDKDPDTTSSAIQALIAGEVPTNDPAIRAAVVLLASTQNANGSWDSPFTSPAGTGDPNSTSLAILGLTAVGVDVTSACWRDTADPAKAGTAYVNPESSLISLQQTDGHIASPNDGPTPNTFATSQTVEALQRSWLPLAAPGYQVVRANGHVTGFGSALASSCTWNGVVGAARSSFGRGTWLALADGGVITEGDAAFFGSMGGTKLNKPVVGIAPTPSGRGYWLVAADGGIFTFGDAQYFGGLGAIELDQPIVGIAATPSGKGYTLFASDGGVFAFGDATFKGSMGGIRLNKPVVGGTSTADGKGYWMVASDGGIFSFGDATFKGSLGALKLDKPIVGMQDTGDGKGYWLVGADGGVFTFGDAPFLGAAIGEPGSPAVAIAS